MTRNLNLISATAAVALASSAFATVSGTLVADAYIVKDGAGANAVFYSVIDLYIKGNNLGDVANPLTGLSSYNFELASSLSTKDGGGVVTAKSNLSNHPRDRQTLPRPVTNCCVVIISTPPFGV